MPDALDSSIVDKRITEVAWGGRRLTLATLFVYLGGAKAFRAEACGLQGEFILLAGSISSVCFVSLETVWEKRWFICLSHLACVEIGLMRV